MKKIFILSFAMVFSPFIEAADPINYCDDARQLFELTQTVSKHPNQVNIFHNIDEVYKSYLNSVKPDQGLLAVPPLSKEEADIIGHNEIITTIEYQEVINPKLRSLIAGYGYQPKDQFNSFRKLFLENKLEEIQKLSQLANDIAQWIGFKLAADNNQLSLEFFTEWTHTGARLIDNLNAFFFAAYLNQECNVPKNAWQKFQTTKQYNITLPFRTLIEDITKPITSTKLYINDQEGMSISTALQDFRRKKQKTESSLFPVQGSKNVEKLFASKLKTVELKFDAMQHIVNSYNSVEEAYLDLKANPDGKMKEANNIRREIGGTGFLVALQQAIKADLISEKFFIEHVDFISKLVALTNEMDKYNFEINLGFGKYEGDAIPSPYLFFANLKKIN
ncbi:MAG: hypothetical protein P4L22_05110 [Candidatus Babeliales bacterium]|nr:hypothetical protein [Candidatus Babeliales bacterium]